MKRNEKKAECEWMVFSLLFCEIKAAETGRGTDATCSHSECSGRSETLESMKENYLSTKKKRVEVKKME